MMKKGLIHVGFVLLLATLMGCYTAERKMYKRLDNSGYLFLSHYTSLMPSLGPCGFSRSSDNYDIKTPRIKGRIESNELYITDYASDHIKYTYVGYIEFLKDNKVYVDLYRVNNGVKTKLTINGTHHIKVEDDKIGDRKI